MQNDNIESLKDYYVFYFSNKSTSLENMWNDNF